MKKIITLIALFHLAIWSQTNVSGIISSNTTWTLAGSPYIVTNSVIVDSTSTLIIEAGVVVKFNAAKGIKIDGTLIALGTATQNILFTSNVASPQPGDWTYLFFTNSSKDAITDADNNYISGSVLQYSQIEYSGASLNRAIYCDNSTPLIKNCLVKSNLGTAIYAINPNNIKILNSVLRDNIRTGNEYSSNGGGIYISGGNGNILNNIIYNNQAYQIASGIDIRATINYTLISGNSVYSNTSNGNDVGVGGIRVSQNTALVEISDNQIYANNGTAGYQGDGGGIKISNNQDEVIVKSNLIERNYPVGISIGQGGFGPTGFARILDNKIYKNQGVGIYFVSSNSDSTQIVGNLIIDNSNCGIFGHVSVKKVLIENNVISGNGFNGANKYGIIFHTFDISNTKIHNNSVISNDAGGIDQRVFNTGSSNSIIGNTFYGNIGNASIQLLENWNTVSQNNFLDTTTYSLSFSGGSSTSLTCANNWWGSASTSNISSRIYDFEDDASKGTVNYQPFLNNLNITAPLLPVKRIFKSSVSGGVKITWSPNEESDIVGYKIYYGSPTGYSFANVINVGNVTSYTLNGFALTDTIAVTAYDAQVDGINDQVEGHEGWFSEAVIQQSAITLTSPNGSETWQAGSTQNITWVSTNVANVKLEYTTNSGTNWNIIIASTPPSSASYAWTIPNTPATNCKVKVSDADNSETSNVSDNVFTINGMDSITYGGKTYHTVTIGTQTWLKENLDIGTMIQGSANPSNNGTIEKYCYDNNLANCDTYGGLYQWNEAMAYNTASGAQGICPIGWHLPTKTEYDTLIETVNHDGNSLKAIGQGIYNDGNESSGIGTNSSGFSAFLAGHYNEIQSFSNLGNYTYLLCSTEGNSTNLLSMVLYSNDSNITINTYNKAIGTNVRCLKNESSTALLQITSPNGSEIWQAGSTQNITWASTGITNVKLEYTTDDGTNWTTVIASTPASSGSYAWTVTNTPSTLCKVRATDATNAALFDVSDTTFTISDGNWTVYNTTNSSLPHNSIKTIAVDNAGIKWIGTENGLAKYDGTNWTVYTTANSSLPYNYVSSIAIDGAGNKWIGTFSRYLAKFDNVNWTVYNTNDWGLPIGAIQAIAIDAAGNKWIGTSEGLAKFDGTTGTIYTTSNSGLPYKAVQSIAIDEQGNKWIGTLDSGLVKFDGTNWTVYKTTNSQIPNNQVHAIAISRYGNKWLGTTGGFAKFDGTNWNVYDRTADYLDNWVFTTAIDNSGNKWTGSLGGVGLFDGTNWTSYRTTNSGLSDSRINAIAIDASANKWFGTNAGGVAVLKSGTTISKALALQAPNGSESWQANASKNITWSSTNVSNIKLEYSTNNGTNWTIIIASTSAGSGSYAWTIPGVSSTNCKVRISDATNSDLTDMSDNVFTIIKIIASPQNLTASSGSKQVTLNWKRNSEADLRVYRIYGGTSANPTNKVDSVSYTDTTKTIFNLTNGTVYYYRITAVDSTGNESGYSNEVSATPAPKTYTVKTDGSGNFNSIQAAIDAAKNEDTIVVYNGTYYENINFSGKAIIVRSASGSLNTTINGNQAGSCVRFISGETSSSIIDGFTITNGSGTLVSGIQRFGGGIYCYNGSNPTIKNCIITGNSASAGSGGGIECWYASATIENCIIKNNSNHGIANAFGNGVLVINCLIYGNYGNDNGGGIKTGGGSSPTIINSTIVKNDSYFHTNSGIYAISGGTVINSIVRDNTGIDATIAQGATSVTYSNIDGGFTGTGNIDVDPLFVDPVNNNYHLTNISPCIGAATSPNAPLKDIEGNPRPNPSGSNPDMGAYENSLANPNSPITLIAPNGGESFTAGTIDTIKWTSTNIANVKLEYTTNSGTDWTTIIASTPASSGSYAWILPYSLITNCKVRVLDTNAPTIFDESDNSFEIVIEYFGSWSEKAHPYITGQFTAIDFVNSNVGYLSGTNIGPEEYLLFKTTSGGQSWVGLNQNVMTVGNYRSISFINNNLGYVGCVSGTIKTIDGGTTWEFVNIPYRWGEKIYFIDSLNGWVAKETGIQRTTDGGNTWLLRSLPSNITEFCFVDKFYGWALCEFDKIYNTTDGGLTWNGQFQHTSKGALHSLHFVDRIHGWAIVNKTDSITGILYKTVNGGQSWEKINLPDFQWKSIRFLNADTGWVVGSLGKILYSSNGGRKWVEQITNSTDYIHSLSIEGNNIWALGAKSILKYDIPISSTITLSSPNGGESFVAGTVDTIKWISTSVTNVKLEYTTNSGTDWATIIASTPASSGSYAWTIPNTPSTQCKVKISDVDNSSIADTSDNIFSISIESITYGGKIYHIIRIGTQTWLKENLDIGTMIDSLTNPSNNGTIEKYCYGNNPSNCTTYGGLYQWNEAMAYSTTSGTQGICPTGWHVPTQSEFSQSEFGTLATSVGNDGNALKAVGQGTGSGAGTNTSGFSAMLAGGRQSNRFYNLGVSTSIWGSQESGATGAYGMYMGWDHNDIILINFAKNFGFSVRCLKDETPTASLQIISPNGGESFVAGTVDTIKWISTNVANVKLEYTTNSGTDWATIIANIPANSGSYAWLIPTISSTNCRTRISDVTNSLLADTSDNVFSINYVNGYDSITYAGKIYHTVKIGNQTWLQENLDIGTMIQTNTASSDNGTIEKYCYDNNPTNCDIYGGLYKWNESLAYSTTPGVQGICPTGWHVPTKVEFETLRTEVSNDGNALKAIGQGSGNSAGTNTSGFSGLLGGYRYVDGIFYNMGNFTYYWSSTEYNISNTYTLGLSNIDSNILLAGSGKDYGGFSVRCLKNEIPIASIQITSPNGGESFTAGTVDTINWTSSNITNVKLEYTTNSGTNWATIIASTPASSGSYAWLIPTVSSTNCKTRISDVTNSLLADTSDNIFSINYVNGYDSITYAGKIYHTVKIGNQTWLKENLDIGTMIDSLTNASNDGTIEKYCYNNSPTNCDTYGGLYQWNEAMAYSTFPGTQGICPTGWHIPTQGEFNTLASLSNYNGNVLKTVGQGTGIGVGTNTSGFSALLAGYRNYNGFFDILVSGTYFWSSTQITTTNAFVMYLWVNDRFIYVDDNHKGNGFSIRCLKDESPTAILQLTSPNGGENFVAGTVDTIKWTSTSVTNVKLEYTTNSGTDWATIIASTPASSGSYAWTIPNTPSTQCKVKISDVDNASVFDTSGIFTIAAPVQKITVTSPNGGERWKGNSSQQITWGVGSGKQSAVGSSQSAVLSRQSAVGNGQKGLVSGEEIGFSKKLKVESGKLSLNTENRELTTLNQELSTNNSIENVRIDYSTDNGTSWTTIVSTIPASQSNYSWIVPGVNSQNCKIRVVDHADTTVADTSNAVFEIYSPQITVTSPNGGESWQAGSSHAITWTQTNVDTVKIAYTTNQGSGWIPITEKPASAGTYTWVVPSTISATCKVRISDKSDSTFADSSNAVFAITSIPVVQILVSSPNGGENWKVGESHNITWTSSNVDTVKLEFSTNNGGIWLTVKDSVKASLGTLAWTIPNTPSTQCKVRISDFKNSSVGDSSNAIFTIELVVQKSIAVTSPNGGESWKVGSTQSITWTSSNVNKFKLEYTTNNGTAWQVVGYSSSSPYSWVIPNTASVQCKVRISDSTNAAVWDTSKAVFTIYKPSITVVYPNGGEELQVGANVTIAWQSSNVANVAVEYSTTNKRTWNTVSSSVAASNQSLSWTVPDSISDSCFIRIKDVSDNTIADTSNAKFIIIAASPASLTLTSPVGNEQWRMETKHFITWTKNKVTTVKIEFSSNDGSSWSNLTSSAVADSGKYEWTVPNTASSVCRIKISDANNSQLFSVSPLPFTIYYAEIIVTAPNGGEEWLVSETKAISWTSTGVNKVKVELSTDNGANWTVQKDSATASMGTATWVVPNLPSADCKIKLSDAHDLTVFDVSDQVFTIKGFPKIQVLSPKASDVWEIGTTKAITWYRENIEQVKIELSTNSGGTWMNIASSVQASDQSYPWDVQNYPSQICLIRISDVVNPSFGDTSDVFSIVTKVKPVVLTPNGGEKLTLGEAYDITWKLGSGKLIAPKAPSHKSSSSKGNGETLDGAAETSNIRIQLSTDDGISWATINNQISVDSAKYTWTVSGEPSSKCFIKIVDINDAASFDLSDSAFVILDNKFPNILVSTNSLDFGNIYKDSTEEKQINITNTGTADLQIQSTSFYQTSSAYNVTTFNQTIKPDSTREVLISFKPTEIISYTDTLYVYHNAAGSLVKIALTGSGIEVPKPIIKIAVTSVTFDTTYIGSNNQKTITIVNEGTADLFITNISANKSVFSTTETSFTVGAGLQHLLTLNFTPTSDSSYSGTLTIQHNAAGSPSQISLMGKGQKHVPNIVLSSKEMNFGVITVYTQTEASFSINNSGTADLVVTNIHSSNSVFTTVETNFMVAPNSSQEVHLKFTPLAATQYTGTLTISHNTGSGVTTLSMNGAGYPVDVIVTRTITFGDISLSGNYRMVGLPGNSNIPITQTVSGSQKTDWNAFFDNGIISANQSDYLKEYDGSSKYTFKPGNGFWIVSKNGLTVSANVQPVPLATDSTYSIPLQANWNIISNPFEKSTSWTKIKQLNGLTTHPLYKWNGQTYDQVSEMTTYEGFYFYNTPGLMSLKIPYDASGTLKKFFKEKEVYQLGEKGFSIDCKQRGVERSSVYAGFNTKASNDADDYDYFMPPADFGEVTLVLQNDSLSTDYKKLIVEQRKEIGEGTQFDFTAKNLSKEAVQLTVNGIEFFPESETYLLDKQYNKFTNLKEKNMFSLPQQMGKRSYALLVGSPAFIQERKAVIIPTEYLLYQNFPNPFNPATTIAFGLPKESNVTLTLYNMLGEVVLRDELGSKTSGYHEMLLDLSSKTSGVYFYSIQANALDGSKNFREVKKMMLLK
ncbi:MAG: FISUMP domain-containing protein [Melioribacteraceae bacterium]